MCDCSHQESKPYEESIQHIDRLFEVLNHKWMIKIIGYLYLVNDECRYTSIQRQLPGISKKVLSNILQSLERYGLVVRLVQMGYPPKVSYRLSGLGISLYMALKGLADWGREHLGEMESNAVDFENRMDLYSRNPWQ